MEINIDNKNFPVIIGGLTLLVLFIIITMETSIGIALLISTGLLLIYLGYKRMANAGIVNKPNVLLTQLKNYNAIKKVRDPKLKSYTPQEYKEFKENQKKKKWNVNW